MADNETKIETETETETSSVSTEGQGKGENNNPWVQAAKEASSVLINFISAIILICSVNELTLVHKGREVDCMQVPANINMRFQEDDLPYKNPSGKFYSMIESFVEPILYMLSFFNLYKTKGDNTLSYWYRKNYTFSGDFLPHTIISSWTWMRYSLFVMCVFIRDLYPKELMESRGGTAIKRFFSNKRYSKKMRILYYISGIILSLIAGGLITIISLIAAVFGAFGCALGAINYSFLTRLYLPITLVICIPIAVVLFIIQFIHNIILFYASIFKKRKAKYGLYYAFGHVIWNYIPFVLAASGGYAILASFLEQGKLDWDAAIPRLIMYPGFVIGGIALFKVIQYIDTRTDI